MFLNCCTVLIQVQNVEQQNKLQQARLLRTPQERNFRESDCMACVYDWVGSLSIIPVHFQLLDYAGRMLLPSQPVKQAKNTTLCMSEAMLRPPFEDKEVTILGFGINEWEPLDDSNYLVHPISETVPEQLLECDER